MEGYSVTEAASILGVPTERVWELLARGVLSGAPEGETGMRVYLQPRPAPAAVDEPRRSNGHEAQREPGPESSPFRELLSEFRNLTERYGQALLALGEARGEVASLRSRVDVLETRMDLRLPMSSPMPDSSTWGAPAAPPPDGGSTVDQPDPATKSTPPTAEAEISAEERQPPTTADPPEPPPVAQPDGGSSSPPRRDALDLAGIELENEAESSARRKRGRGHFSAEFADALARAEDPSAAVLPSAAAAGATLGSVRHTVAARREEPSEPDAVETLLPREGPAAEPMDDGEAEPEPDREAAAVPEVPPEPEVAAPPPGDGLRELTWDRERYSADIDAPDWWTPEASLWPEPEAALAQSLAARPNPTAKASPDERPVAAAGPGLEATPRAPHRGEETLLWHGQRPEPSEATDRPSKDAAGGVAVASTGRRAADDEDERLAMPGSDDLHEALAALDALGQRRTQPADVSEAMPAEPAGSRAAAEPPAPEVRSPASRAYRRLRRIFPG
ncbi:MAG: hypothetical protein ABR593_09350 [Candidatus Limnocylindria bacterium]